jgi:hypothetical protein
MVDYEENHANCQAGNSTDRKDFPILARIATTAGVWRLILNQRRAIEIAVLIKLVKN